MQRSVWNVLKLLATSRKVWVAVIGAGCAVLLYVQGAIDADKLASSLVALAMAVILAIAAEDSAEKIGGQVTNVTNAAAESVDFDPRCCKCGAVATFVGEGPKWYCAEHSPWDAISLVIKGL